MPTAVDEQVQGFAHCVDPRCPGHNQQAVPAIRRETSYTYVERGGDAPGIEQSHVQAVFADEADSVCPACNGQRDISLDPRPQYDPLSGFDPNYLASGGAQPFDPTVVNSPADEEVAALRAEVARLAALMSKDGES